jgi:asparagine synthase (glutamine-hydrolysing)
MCGIIGIASTKTNNNEWIKNGLNSMIHRGPDDFGIYSSRDNKICFGHRRLSIIDLSNFAKQPMVDQNSGNSLTFNGEIYNYKELMNILKQKGYKFFSKSDTEVILKSYEEWGENCVSHFNGMFSFALHDRKNNKVFLARDRAGEKPLYYSFINETLVFSSELKGLFYYTPLKRKINRFSFDNYLAWGYVSSNKSIIEGVNKLKAAHTLTFNVNTGKIKENNYWNLPLYSNSIKFNYKELVSNCEKMLEDSVKNQLVADVPVGILLSGGVDSSLITAMASRHKKKVSTYSVIFKDHGSYDESNHSRLISNYFDTNHHELEASNISTDIFTDLAFHFDEPVVDSSMIPTYMVSKLISKHCKVALGGDGGDELFGGYSTYPRYLQMQKLNYLPLKLRKFIANTSHNLMPIGMKGRNWLTQLDIDLKNHLPIPNGPFNQKERIKLMSRYSDWKTTSESTRKGITSSEMDIIQKATRMDFKNYLSEDILVKVDRASMANSLELRSPFLDYKLIEFAFEKVPSNLKVYNNQKKILLKKVCKNVLPSNFNFNRKQGFSLPLSSYLKSDKKWNDLITETLFSNDSIYNKSFLKTFYNLQSKQFINSEKVFGLVLFELWRKKHGINF